MTMITQRNQRYYWKFNDPTWLFGYMKRATKERKDRMDAANAWLADLGCKGEWRFTESTDRFLILDTITGCGCVPDGFYKYKSFPAGIRPHDGGRTKAAEAARQRRKELSMGPFRRPIAEHYDIPKDSYWTWGFGIETDEVTVGPDAGPGETAYLVTSISPLRAQELHEDHPGFLANFTPDPAGYFALIERVEAAKAKAKEAQDA